MMRRYDVLTVVRLKWDTVDEGQWWLLRTLLSTEQLAPYGCMSSRLRRSGTVLLVDALWDDKYGAQIFCEGRLRELVTTAGLEDPEATQVSLPGLYAAGRRPVGKADDAGRAEPEGLLLQEAA